MLYVASHGECRIVPKVRMSPELRQALLEQRAAFVRKFGREPGPGDPVLFDPDKDFPTRISADRMASDLADTMRKAGIGEGKIEAFLKGLR
jgi:hypothetical protein